MMNLKTKKQEAREESGQLQEEQFTGISWHGAVKTEDVDDVEKLLSLGYLWNDDYPSMKKEIETSLSYLGVTKAVNHDLKKRIEL